MQTYYETPTQVKFLDYDNMEWCGGIAYKNEIICLCCGGVVDIEDYLENCEDCLPNMDVNPIVPFSKWVNLSNECIGN